MTPPIDIQSPAIVLKALWNLNKPVKKEPESIIYTVVNYFKKSNFVREVKLIEEIDKYVQE